MAVHSTVVENGRTVRTWTESRGNKTLVRKFYIKYELNAYLNGKWGRKVFNTLTEADRAMCDWMKLIIKKYGFDNFIGNEREILTHIDGYCYLGIGGHSRAKCYITEICSGEPTISEDIVEGYAN